MIFEEANPTEVRLGPAGAARREAMLGELIRAMEGHHRRRRVRRRVMLAAGCGLVLALVATAATSVLRPAPRSTAGPVTARAAPAPASTVIRSVDTDPAVLSRHRAAGTHHAVILGDRDLIDTLARIERPAGLIRQDGRARLTAHVTDRNM